MVRTAKHSYRKESLTCLVDFDSHFRRSVGSLWCVAPCGIVLIVNQGQFRSHRCPDHEWTRQGGSFSCEFLSLRAIKKVISRTLQCSS
jgi:hypothetical protein